VASFGALLAFRGPLPVVIVATEEGLSRIPKSVREGSLALGATKAETIWRVVVPMSAPAMMTGLILAGFPGGPRYCEGEPAQYSEWEIGLMAAKMARLAGTRNPCYRPTRGIEPCWAEDVG
jgi:hypothetical protein